MTVTIEQSYRNSNMTTLEEKFEVVKQIGDGSFGSVVLARTRTAGSNVARRGTMVAIKTMKKTFPSFASCLELREVIFLRTLPHHPHLVPALDIFLDPLSRKLHICMEYMDCNLYQLMKARDHKHLDGKSVKSILYQILCGLDHIHAHSFFHRDIKPENILVSSSAPMDSSPFGRYSNLVTPPSTPPTYTVKIADFGLARETHSKVPYTTYVSTRWYRAPEVLLRAGEYSAPVDMWAIGAMAVEIATLKPLFPGGNEVDQVWRVCEIMGSPGNWYSKSGSKVGGGEWKEGIRLAQKLGFSFPKMAPHSLESVLQPPQWPASLSNFVTWCLMWDPKSRPTSSQALNHEYFADAVDPLRPKSSTARLLGRKQSDKSFKSQQKDSDSPMLSSKPSWFRRSLIGRSESPAPLVDQTEPAKPAPQQVNPESHAKKSSVSKRATWTNGAPMPILPSIRPVSPLSNAVHAQANATITHAAQQNKLAGEKQSPKKIGRQLSLNSTGNHYSDIHRQETEKALSGGASVTSPLKEGFFSHLRKRARRLSGRNQISLPTDDVEAAAGCAPWSNRSSMAIDSINEKSANNLGDLDKALQGVKYSLEMSPPNVPTRVPAPNPTAKRQSLPQVQQVRSGDNSPLASATGSISSRTRRGVVAGRPLPRYETPEEEDELLHEVLQSTTKAVRKLGQNSVSLDEDARQAVFPTESKHQPIPIARGNSLRDPYPTPSPTAVRDGYMFTTPTHPLNMNKPDPHLVDSSRQWPTPPYDESDWATGVSSRMLAAGNGNYR